MAKQHSARKKDILDVEIHAKTLIKQLLSLQKKFAKPQEVTSYTNICIAHGLGDAIEIVESMVAAKGSE